MGRPRSGPVDDSNTREQVTGNAECDGADARAFANAKNFGNHDMIPDLRWEDFSPEDWELLAQHFDTEHGAPQCAIAFE